MPTSIARLTTDLMPYLPMVNAIAPKAPMGAAFIRIATILKIGCANAVMNERMGFPRSPTIASEMPNNTATNST
ncbi:hypothetical protein D3C87_1587820 [compost metagenome]